MNQKLNPEKIKNKLWIYENPERVLIISSDVDVMNFSCSYTYDVIIAKREVWESNEEMRLLLLQCISYNSNIILI